jgi:hypothetical protein
MARTDLRSLARDDMAFLGLGAVVLVASFLPWYGTSTTLNLAGHVIHAAPTTNAWHRWTALGVLLMLIATGIVAAELFGEEPLPALTVPWSVVVLGVDAVGALLVVVKSLDVPSGHTSVSSYGLRWGGWVLLAAAVAQVAVAAWRLRAGRAGGATPAAEPSVE